MESTNQHEITLNSDVITPIQMVAIKMRAEGAKLSEISQTIEVPENTIKNWFRTGTRTYLAYKNYSDQVVYSIGVDAEYRLRHLTEKATQTIEDLMSDENSPAIRAKVAMYILDQTAKATEAERQKRLRIPEAINEAYRMASENVGPNAGGEKLQMEFERLMDEYDKLEQFV